MAYRTLPNKPLRRLPSSAYLPYAPPANRETYKDLLVFEERLKQNAERLQRQRRKYEAFLVALIALTLLSAYSSLLAPSSYALVHYFNVGLLLVCATTLVLFFATGMYSEKIAYAYKFVPQANRALRSFNLYLNTHRRLFPSPWSLFRLGFTRSGAATTRAGNVPASPTSSSPPPRKGAPLHPIPPPIHPRGELLFSSKVSPQFREGYERYRSDYEKRRGQPQDQAVRRRSRWPFGSVLPSPDVTARSSSPSQEWSGVGAVALGARGRDARVATSASRHASRRRGGSSVSSHSSNASSPSSSRASSPALHSPSRIASSTATTRESRETTPDLVSSDTLSLIDGERSSQPSSPSSSSVPSRVVADHGGFFDHVRDSSVRKESIDELVEFQESLVE